MRLNLEEKCIDAEKLNASLQNEIARLKADNSAIDRNLKTQLDEQASKHAEQIKKLREEHEDELREASAGGARGGATGDMRVDELLRENEQLKMEIREQEEVTEEVRREATEFLEQMRSLSQDSEQAWAREESLHNQIEKLEEEVREWKGKYAKIKTQLRSIRAASMGLPLTNNASAIGDGNLSDPKGLVKDVHITKYQIAIDDLLRMARNGEAPIVLDYMKTVIMATRAITQGIDDSASASDPNADALMKAKVRVSATANNLITASKNHATGSGLSPVSLLDAAASHLTAAMVELIKLAKIKPTPASEVAEDILGDEEIEQRFDSSRFPDPPNMNGMSNGSGTSAPAVKVVQINGNTANGVKTVNGNAPSSAPAPAPLAPMSPPRYSDDSVYSTLSSPPRSPSPPTNLVVSPPAWGKKRSGTATLSQAQLLSLQKGPAFGIRTDTTNVEDLRLFVETQFEGIVESIQSLLSVIRSDSEIPAIQIQILEIATVVGKVLDSTEAAMAQTGNGMLRERGDIIVAELGDCRSRMVAMASEEDKVSKAEIKEFKSRLAGLAFRMAKEIKVCVSEGGFLKHEGWVVVQRS